MRRVLNSLEPMLPPTWETPFRLDADLARSLAETWGTPLYVLDEATLRYRAQRYHEALAASTPSYSLTYASKANSTFAVLAILAQEGCTIDCASEGELEAARRAGVPASSCNLHGNNKPRQALETACERGIHEIIVDSYTDIDHLIAIQRAGGQVPDLLIRLAPGVNPKTHVWISTGQSETKFGFQIADGAAEAAVKRMLDGGLPLRGVHCHVGSQLLDSDSQVQGGIAIAAFAVRMAQLHRMPLERVNIGGGLGVQYSDEDNPIALQQYCLEIAQAVRAVCEPYGYSPALVHEPGRSMVSHACVSLYTLGEKKFAPVHKYWSVDGGLSDNPRPALYDARYSVEVVGRDGPTETVTVSGSHCEVDELFADVSLPVSSQAGDLLQVLSTGAYNASMASNYNRFCRPAAVLRRLDGSVELVQTRETHDQLFAREVLPNDLRSEPC
ncbi:MAG: diaminopimelate decarboxylase [Chthonomonas sp.]|nr:diaminopimelate decarboxylase [Chthonomonas sp.]